MSKIVKIYAIVCPITKDVKYIGKTFGTLKDRLSKHYSNSRDNSKKKKWIDNCIENFVYPEIILLEEVNNTISNISEQKWISHYGIDNLLNENKGGGGCSAKGYDNVLEKYKLFLNGKYSKNTVSNYVSCIRKFLNHYKDIDRPKNINKNDIIIYLESINDLNTKKVALSSIKLFYSEIIGQPKKITTVKYQYK